MFTHSGKTELLSPAGSFDSARAAVNAGADAIYMGGPFFSARAFAESSAAAGSEGGRPDGKAGSSRDSEAGSRDSKAGSHDSKASSRDMLSEAIDFCHLRGVRVFMTLNTLLKENETARLEEYLAPYVRQHLDGVIIQDIGVFHKVREMFPELELHVSTQAAVTGWRTAQKYLDMGAKRIVLARELSLREIREIKEKTGAELEVFAHGALCYSYSGNCLMSSFIGGRSGNRGKCAGTCRLPFDVLDPRGRQLNRKNEQYILSMCDLNTLSRLGEMIQAGVYSFKIEGRMKSPLFTAAVTSVYRKYLDLAEKLLKDGKTHYDIDPADAAMLADVFDRSGTTDGYLDNRNGREMLTLAGKPDFRSHNDRIINELKAEYIDKDMKVPVEAEVTLKEGCRPELRLTSGNVTVCASTDIIVSHAEKRPVTEAEVREKTDRFGETDFELAGLRTYVDKDIFIPVKVLNELRRNAADELKRRLLEGGR